MSDAGSPHMGLDDYRKMGIPETGERQPQRAADPQRDGPLEQQLRQRLEQDELVDASTVQIRVQGGHITLEGTAQTRYAKERAESIAQELAGEAGVENRIHVQPQEEAPGPVLTIRDPESVDEPSTQRS